MPEKKTGKPNIIGERIRAARLMQKPPITQKDLAARLTVYGVPVDRSMVVKMENQERSIKDFEIEALSNCLRLPVEWFFGRESGEIGVKRRKL